MSSGDSTPLDAVTAHELLRTPSTSLTPSLLARLPHDPYILQDNLSVPVLSTLLPWLREAGASIQRLVNDLYLRALIEGEWNACWLLRLYGPVIIDQIERPPPKVFLEDQDKLFLLSGFATSPENLHLAILHQAVRIIRMLRERGVQLTEEMRNDLHGLKDSTIFSAWLLPPDSRMETTLLKQNHLLRFLSYERKLQLLESAMESRTLEMVILLVPSENVTWPNSVVEKAIVSGWSEGVKYFVETPYTYFNYQEGVPTWDFQISDDNQRTMYESMPEVYDAWRRFVLGPETV